MDARAAAARIFGWPTCITRGTLRGAQPLPADATFGEFMLIPENFTPPAGLLAERVVLVTGASSGLGRALAIECARAGATVILCGRNGAKLGRVYDEIESMGAPQPAIATLDLATATATHYDALADTIEAEFGRLDGLVHSAGVLGGRTPPEQYAVPAWARARQINPTARVDLTHAVL